MLSVTDVLGIMANGRDLPQQAFPAPTDAQIEKMQELEPELLHKIIWAADNQDPAKILTDRLGALAEEFGWYPAVSIMCMLFAHRYKPDDVPDGEADLEEYPEGAQSLVRIFSIAASRMGDDEGAWTIPLAMLADLGREQALRIAVCTGFCAAIGEITSLSAEGAES